MLSKNIEVEKEFISNTFKSWLKEDYYTILGINSNSSNEQINLSFKKLVKTSNPSNHPDGSIARKYAEFKLKHLIEIRAILLDRAKRIDYDFKRQLSQDCYLDYIISSSSLINTKGFKINNDIEIKKEKKSNLLNKYVNQNMKIYNISESESKKLDEIYQFCKSTTLLN